jgi:DNA-binding transcriptional MocR family regulator
LRTLYQHKRDVMAATLAREMGDRMRWIDPRGGFFLWAEITSLTDCDTLLRHARTHGVIFVAGSAFYVDGTGQQTLRLSFLGAVTRAHRGRVQTSGAGDGRGAISERSVGSLEEL